MCWWKSMQMACNLKLWEDGYVQFVRKPSSSKDERDTKFRQSSGGRKTEKMRKPPPWRAKELFRVLVAWYALLENDASKSSWRHLISAMNNWKNDIFHAFRITLSLRILKLPEAMVSFVLHFRHWGREEVASLLLLQLWKDFSGVWWCRTWR